MAIRTFEFPAKGEAPETYLLSVGPEPEPAYEEGTPIEIVTFNLDRVFAKQLSDVEPGMAGTPGREGPPATPEAGPAEDTAATRPLQYRFAMVQPNLGLAVQRVVREIFLIFGTIGIQEFGKSLEPPPLASQSSAGGEPTWTESEYRPLLRAEFDLQWRGLQELLKPVLPAVQKAAAAIALERIKVSQRVVEVEQKRYLAGASLEAKTHDIELKGAQANDLVDALLTIAAKRQEIQALQERVLREEARQRLRYVQPLYLYGVFKLADTRPYASEMARDAASLSASDPVTIAQDYLSQKQISYFEWLKGTLLKFPVLYRIWSDPDLAKAIAEAQQRARRGPAAEAAEQMRQSLLYSAVLRDRVVETLKTVRSASAAARYEIEKEKDKYNVWRYEPLVAEAMMRLAIPEHTVEWRFVNDHMATAKTSVISSLSLAVGMFQNAMVVAGGVAPPVLMAAAVVSAIVNAAEWLESEWERETDKASFDSSFDPAKSFAAEPSSGVWSVVSLVLLVWGTKSDLKQVAP